MPVVKHSVFEDRAAVVINGTKSFFEHSRCTANAIRQSAGKSLWSFTFITPREHMIDPISSSRQIPPYLENTARQPLERLGKRERIRER